MSPNTRFRSPILYVVYLAALFVASLVPSLSWLAPAAMVVLLAGILWLWRSTGHPLHALAFQRDTA